MFYAVTRRNYKVNADTEAEHIKKAKKAYAVRYEGMRTLVVFETANDLLIYNSFKARSEGMKCKA